MINPATGLDLPVAIGGLSSGSGSRDGSRAESVTRDDGVRASAAPTGSSAPTASLTEPKDEVEATPTETQAPPLTAPPLTDGDDEVEVLHKRFDRMEQMLKRKIMVASLHGRFDALEAWLNARFGA